MPKDMTNQGTDDADSEMMFDHCAKELIHAVHSHDHESFKNSFRAMLAMHNASSTEEEQGNGE